MRTEGLLLRLQTGYRYDRNQQAENRKEQHQHIRGFDETPTMATSLGPRCAIRDPPIRDYLQKPTRSDQKHWHEAGEGSGQGPFRIAQIYH
jgi:hypothetical protein